ncbi:MAG: zinc ABC transporter ATP-binding protein [Candidatus Levybacteria bacterium RIFCSPHIGHO2_01_FULL_36_15]|nr:MAG: zinc ABC transporter ATP-binding protein [Candidatus Levybacteria bacterium RIFCSPHIGHO2_01_FULL_36_15]OGH38671.1 MAG: zinc ABC transporter ATP-binding protein [Candidatus Levybacteria bacterium RIFCSPLOWO2_01_FULL_36_10]
MQHVDHAHTIIELDRVCFSYTNEEVIKDVSLEIHKGDYVGIVGPNGGGKSTLLKLMLGILKPNDGTVRLFGSDIKDFKDWSKIGYVPQKTYIEINFPVIVEELVAMGRYGKQGLFHFPTKEDKEKTLTALKQVDMLGYKDRQINDLSGGQQQRVFIARALATEPEIIFLDEPTVGVDIKTQKQFYALLRKLNKELALTLVLVTHELDVVAHEATELGYINRTMEYYGNPEEFLKGAYFHELIGRGGLHH